MVNDRKIFPELRKIIQDEKLKDREEERQHALQKANLMIFGVSESGEDEEFAKYFIEDVGVKAEVKYAIRVGNKKADQVRPIKIVTGFSHQQNLIIQSLVNLKGNSRYRRISETEDSTLCERRQIKKWSNKAVRNIGKKRRKEKNFFCPITHIWCAGESK